MRMLDELGVVVRVRPRVACVGLPEKALCA